MWFCCSFHTAQMADQHALAVAGRTAGACPVAAMATNWLLLSTVPMSPCSGAHAAVESCRAIQQGDMGGLGPTP